MPPSPNLSSIFQGVEFIVQDEEQSIRAIATRELLEDVFGAQSYPESWIRTYCENVQVIHSAVGLLYRSRYPHNRPEAVVLSGKLWNELSAGLG